MAVTIQTKAVGIIYIVMCIGMTYLGTTLLIDQPITKQTSSFLHLDNMTLCAFIASVSMSSLISMVVTFFIGMAIDRQQEIQATEWFVGNPVSKTFTYIALATWGLGIVGAGISYIIDVIY